MDRLREWVESMQALRRRMRDRPPNWVLEDIQVLLKGEVKK